MAFHRLKKAVTQPPMLALPNFSMPFTIECDASGNTIVVVLMQQGRYIAFYSQALKEKSLVLFTCEKELYSLVSTINRWRLYLLGQAFLWSKQTNKA